MPNPTGVACVTPSRSQSPNGEGTLKEGRELNPTGVHVAPTSLSERCKISTECDPLQDKYALVHPVVLYPVHVT